MPALERMKILDLTQYEAGTSCTQLLAWMGANVVKVEQAGVGDPGRHTEPGRGDSLYFLSFNANKRSLALNLRSEEGRALFLKLLPRFDVVVENFSLGTMEKFGLGYDVLKAHNPRIIYASVKGFGTFGPYAQYKCYDMVAQAFGGAFSLTGTPETPPMRPGPTMGDTGTGMLAAMGILAAYIQREQTGEGQRLEVSMQEAVANLIRCGLSHREREPGLPVPRRGNRTISPTDLYPCAPGGPNDYIYIMPQTRRMIDALWSVIGRPELSLDERFHAPKGRREHGDEIFEYVAEWTRQRTKQEAMEALGAAGVPAGAVLDTIELLSDPHLKARGMVVEVEHPERGVWEFIGPPVHMSASKVEVKHAPLLGQHSAEVLREELAMDDATLAALAAAGIVGVREPTAVAVEAAGD
jgi:formyl-CoA transferase